MLLIDVNVLIYAHRQESPRHKAFRQWMESTVSSNHSFSIPGIVRSGFLRIVTHPGIFPKPTPLEEALLVLNELMEQPNFIESQPGERHWALFQDLCRKSEARGNLIADAFLAALAVEMGAEWISTDRDYAKFPDLKWRHPLEKEK